jgi:cbb3-type cytochrome oxidase maturation protein
VESLFILIPMALVLAVLIGAAFWWSTTSGQFENLEAEGRSVIDDNDRPEAPESAIPATQLIRVNKRK